MAPFTTVAAQPMFVAILSRAARKDPATSVAVIAQTPACDKLLAIETNTEMKPSARLTCVAPAEVPFTNASSAPQLFASSRDVTNFASEAMATPIAAELVAILNTHGCF